MNIAAIVLGVVGIVGLPLVLVHPLGMIVPIVCALLAVIFGFTFRGRVRKGQAQGATGLATAGVVLGILHFVLLVVGVFWAMIGRPVVLPPS